MKQLKKLNTKIRTKSQSSSYEEYSEHGTLCLWMVNLTILLG